MDPDSDASDHEGAEKQEITVVSRFLSFLSFSKTLYSDDGWNNVLADELWAQFKAWSKKNNYRLKIDASVFASELTDFSLMPDSGLRKSRNDKQLFFSINTALMNACLARNNMLDANVW
jgi:hypothetical protein